MRRVYTQKEEAINKLCSDIGKCLYAKPANYNLHYSQAHLILAEFLVKKGYHTHKMIDCTKCLKQPNIEILLANAPKDKEYTHNSFNCGETYESICEAVNEVNAEWREYLKEKLC